MTLLVRIKPSSLEMMMKLLSLPLRLRERAELDKIDTTKTTLRRRRR